MSAEGSGVVVEGSASFPEEAIATPPVADTKACLSTCLYKISILFCKNM